MIRAIRRRMTTRDDSGSAIVEFVLLVGPLMIPLVYLIIAGFETQRTAFAVAAGARQAGRAYVIAGNDADGRAAAYFSANLAMVDQGLPPLDPSAPIIAPDTPYCRGTIVTATVNGRAKLPFLPARLGTIAVSASHTEAIDELQELPC